MKIFSIIVFLLENVIPETINFTEKFQLVIALKYFKDFMAIATIGLHFKVNNILSHFVFKKLSTLRFAKPVLEI